MEYFDWCRQRYGIQVVIIDWQFAQKSTSDDNVSGCFLEYQMALSDDNVRLKGDPRVKVLTAARVSLGSGHRPTRTQCLC